MTSGSRRGEGLGIAVPSCFRAIPLSCRYVHQGPRDVPQVKEVPAEDGQLAAGDGGRGERKRTRTKARETELSAPWNTPSPVTERRVGHAWALPGTISTCLGELRCRNPSLGLLHWLGLDVAYIRLPSLDGVNEGCQCCHAVVAIRL